MEELRSYYRKSLSRRLNELEELRDGVATLEPGAVETVRRTAHSIKGTGTSYGYPEITAAAAEVVAAPDDRLAPACDRLMEVMAEVAGEGDGEAGEERDG